MGTETRTRIALAGLLAATLLSFELLFDGDGYVGPAFLGCLSAMGIAALCRRWGAGSFLTFELSLASLFWYLTLVFQASESFWGLPTPAAGSGIARLVSSGWDTAASDYAPIPVRAGYVIMIVVGFWLATTIAEVATFRWRRPVMASVPCIVLFSVALVVGSQPGAAFFLTAFLVALLTFWATESSHRLRSWGRWVTTWSDKKKKEGEAEHVTGGLARRMGATCILATLVAPVFLPTLGDGWFLWRNNTGAGPGASGSVNLLVDIAPKLLEQSDTTLFTVTATDSAYWRLASLVNFDGRQWHELDIDRHETSDSISFPDFGTETLAQRVNIAGLDGEFLPAAVQPSSISGQTVAHDQESFDLKVDDVDHEDTYTVLSSITKPTYNQLLDARTITPPGDPDISYTYTAGAVSADVREMLGRWINDADGDFAQLLAIQEELRGPKFAYSTDVEFEESNNYLDDFLLSTRAGFCQQFSTAFALLARALGHPTRINVGFLPGSATPATDGTLFTVRGTDAHAWPEVYFEGYGWIAFEPTGRGSAASPVYTIPPSPRIDLLNGTGNGGPAGGPAPDNPENIGPVPEIPIERGTGTALPTPIEEPAWREAFTRLALALVVGMVLWAVFVPLLKVRRTRRRYRRARTPAETALAAFSQFEDDAMEMHTPRGPAESATRFVARLAAERRVAEEPSQQLALLYETAAYSPDGLDRDKAAEAKRLARTLASELWARSSLLQKASRLLSIRSLLAHREPKRTRWARPRPV